MQDALDRVALEAVLQRLLERLVEVRSGDALRARAVEHVAGAALRDEELLAVDGVGVLSFTSPQPEATAARARAAASAPSQRIRVRPGRLLLIWRGTLTEHADLGRRRARAAADGAQAAPSSRDSHSGTA